MYSNAELQQAQVLGAGANRYCVVSPHDEGICLKIILPPQQRQIKNWRQRLQRYLSQNFVRFNENYIEWLAYQRLAHKISPDVLRQHLAACLQLDQHQLGLILSCELVRDTSGEISLSLHHYLKNNLSLNTQQICQAIDELALWLIKHNIPLFDLNSGNLVVQYQPTGQLKLKCIDVKSTFKSKEIIPLSYWSKRLMHKKIRRRASRLKDLIKNSSVGVE
ncbi:YrbL family protein [Acinetobacter sp.]|uniref:YrbL family protein n=1 Tax=Acinetobacter sp. TaxID=472 RepID=UPI0038911435